MIRISKGGIDILCDTQADVRIAMAALTDGDEPALPAVSVVPVVNGVPAGGPAWRVGGPPDRTIREGDFMTPDLLAELEEDKPALRLVSESDDSVSESPTVQHVPVRAILLDVLNAILLFPEGVESRGVAELLGLTDKSIGNRIQRLKGAGLVEKVPHHRQWRATQLARRAKLVKC
jgi:hypothetical protein